jgi:LuxR family maltose regulon positive regulatory protein
MSRPAPARIQPRRPARERTASSLSARDLRPRLGKTTVARPRVDALLEAGSAGRLTLVSAPPGAGKTTALLSWLADRDRVAYVSLTDRDDSLQAFWNRVGAACAAARRSAAPRARARGLDAIRHVEDDDEPLLLVLDDFHAIRNLDVLAAFAELLFDAPDQLRAVVASRRDPDIELHRFRLYGDVTEIRASELAFTPAEAAALFAATGIELDEAHVETLVRRTEGWAAGLRFAALSLRRSGDAESFVTAFDESERAASDYLLHEVLVRQEPQTRDFLLKTAHCDRVCGALANALTGRSDGERQLAELERNNVFVTREPAGGWFRYSALFSELLRAEAAYEAGDDVNIVHHDAAAWFAANGHALEALRHAIAGDDDALTAELIGSLWLQIVGEGHLDVATRLTKRTAPATLRRRPQLALLAAWEQLGSGDLGEADAWLAVAETAARKLRGEELQLYEFGRTVVRLDRARRGGDLAEIEAAADALAELDSPLLPARQRERRRALVLCARGGVAMWRGELADAVPALEEAVELSHRLELHDCEVDATSMLALVDAVGGHLRRAASRATAAVSLADCGATKRGAMHLVPAHAALAICSFEWGDDAGGTSELDAAWRTAEASSRHTGRALAVALRAWAIGHVSAEGAERVRAHLSAWSRGARSESVPPLLDAPFRILRSRLALAEGDFGAAEAALGLDDDDDAAGELLVAGARIALARDDIVGATALLEPVLREESSVLYERASIEAPVLQALASTRAGDVGGAHVWIERALDLAEPEGVRGPFLDAAPGVAEPLRGAIRLGTAHRWLVAALLAVADGRANESAALPNELLEPLSEREQVVLRYLPTLMSNPEIAGELFVSVNTVKTHLKSIYRKLGVSHRREAVRRARELRLIA